MKYQRNIPYTGVMVKVSEKMLRKAFKLNLRPEQTLAG
jgi:hypothetical protein